MMYKTKVTFSVAGLLACSLFLAATLYLGANLSRTYTERSYWTHKILENYLSLSADTYRLFKQYRRSLLAEGGWRGTAELAVFEQQFERKIETLEDEIRAEIQILSDESEREIESEELESLLRLGQEIRLALQDVREAQQLFSEGQKERATALLTTVLEEKIDRRITAMISEAVQEEEAEAAEADRAKAEIDALLVTTAKATAVIVSVAAIIVGLLLRRRLNWPLSRLAEGTRQLAGGDLGHRIELPGHDEFAGLAESFNAMAAELEAVNSEFQSRGEALRQANLELTKRDSLRREFFSEVSHELRTPLTILRGEGEVVLDSDKPTAEEYRTSIKRMVDQTEHLGQLVDDLFLIARVSAGVADLRSKEVALAELANQVCQDIRRLAEPKGMEVSLTGSEEKILILGDRRRLRQLLVILMENAVRYGRQADRISVALRAQGDWIDILVQDTGPGIPAEDLKHVFDRYFRGKTGSRLASEGSGLGLPLARSIVQAHGGEISIESIVGQGTTVTVRLPAGEQDQAANEADTEVDTAP